MADGQVGGIWESHSGLQVNQILATGMSVMAGGQTHSREAKEDKGGVRDPDRLHLPSGGHRWMSWGTAGTPSGG